MTAASREPTLDMWRMFILAVELGSMSRVAERMGTDPAFVGRRLRDLELLLNEELLERSKRGIKATWLGAQRYREAKSVVQEFDDLFSMAPLSDSTSETVRIAVPSSLAPLFVRWITMFGATPEGQHCTVDIEQYSDGMRPDLLSFDYFVCSNDLPNVRVIAISLGRVKRIVAASTDFLKGEPLVEVPEDLEGRRLIAEESGRCLMIGRGQSIAIWVDPQTRVSSGETLAGPAREGLGYAVGVPYWQVHEDILSGKLTDVLPGWQIASNDVWLLRQPERLLSASSRMLERFLSDRWRETPGLSTSKQYLRTELTTDQH